MYPSYPISNDQKTKSHITVRLVPSTEALLKYTTTPYADHEFLKEAKVGTLDNRQGKFHVVIKPRQLDKSTNLK